MKEICDSLVKSATDAGTYIKRILEIVPGSRSTLAVDMLRTVEYMKHSTDPRTHSRMHIAMDAADVVAAMDTIESLSRSAESDIINTLSQAMNLINELKQDKQFNKTIRDEVLKITGGLCFYCNVELSPDGFHVDHIVSRSNGGPDHISNYVPACAPCNRAKGSMSFAKFVLTRRNPHQLRVVEGGANSTRDEYGGKIDRRDDPRYGATNPA